MGYSLLVGQKIPWSPFLPGFFQSKQNLLDHKPKNIGEARTGLRDESFLTANGLIKIAIKIFRRWSNMRDRPLSQMEFVKNSLARIQFPFRKP